MILHSPSDLVSLPKRIISLVPSQTELLFSLGLEEETIGITKFCVHPGSWFKTKIRVGGTKTVDIVKVRSLHPDLIIANKEENVKDQIEELSLFTNVWLTDVNTLPDAIDMIEHIGLITKSVNASSAIINDIKNCFESLTSIKDSIPAAYLIWREPYMTVGGYTFINDMLKHAGFSNVFETCTRYPEVSLEAIRASGARALLLSSEPYPFRQKHLDELSALLPGVLVRLVDGELFSWYGSRLLKSPPYFAALHNEVSSAIENRDDRFFIP